MEPLNTLGRRKNCGGYAKITNSTLPTFKTDRTNIKSVAFDSFYQLILACVTSPKVEHTSC